LYCLAIGISIDDHDRFTIAVSSLDIVSRGHFEVGDSFSVEASLSEPFASHSRPGRFWPTLIAGGENATKLAGAVFSALKTASSEHKEAELAVICL
jgi:hypothetical protein